MQGRRCVRRSMNRLTGETSPSEGVKPDRSRRKRFLDSGTPENLRFHRAEISAKAPELPSHCLPLAALEFVDPRSGAGWSSRRAKGLEDKLVRSVIAFKVEYHGRASVRHVDTQLEHWKTFLEALFE